MEGTSHIIFGLSGAVVAETVLHVTTPPLLPLPSNPTSLANTLTVKLIFYGFAILGSLAPDIDNARSTIGKKLGILSKAIQHFAGHRTLFHSLLGLALIGIIIWIIQFVLGLFLYHQFGLSAGAQLTGGLGSTISTSTAIGVGLIAFLIGYLLHLIADSLTTGGVPWLFPNRTRYGFPPNRSLRFKSGAVQEPILVIFIAVLVLAGLAFGILIL